MGLIYFLSCGRALPCTVNIHIFSNSLNITLGSAFVPLVPISATAPPDTIVLCEGNNVNITIHPNDTVNVQWQINSSGTWVDLTNNATYGGVNDQGALFEYDLTSGIYTVKHSFDINTTGKNPWSGKLVEYPNGTLWGMTIVGGADDGGVIFKYNIMSGSVEVKYEFDGGRGCSIG